MNYNPILATDSYKLTHHKMYNPSTTKIYSYFECRSGAKFSNISFFGLQYILKKYLSTPVTMSHIDEAEKLVKMHLGSAEHFNRKGWEHIVKKYNGNLPIRIYSIPEGSWVSESIPLIAVENTDPDCFWLTNYVETILSQVWYPTTVATLSGNIKNVVSKYFKETTDLGSSHPSIDFMLHDFGFRGVSSMESAGIGGMAHLVHFKGTDTIEGMRYAKNYYDASDNLAYSVPASEHSVMTSDENGEDSVLERLLNTYSSGILSVVADSYNIYDFVSIKMRKFKDKIIKRDGIFVVRPDSNTKLHPHPKDQMLWICQELSEIFGYTENEKGFKEINKVKVLWGDGIDFDDISDILENLKNNKFSASNVATFGMGGGLLQKVNRDTLRCAFKCSYREYLDSSGKTCSMNVFKNPIDSTKVSKGGIFRVGLDEKGKLMYTNGDITGGLLKLVYQNGVVYNSMLFDDIRGLARQLA